MQELINNETGILHRVYKFFIPRQDRSLPHRTRRIELALEDKLKNDARLLVRESLGQRTQLRLFFDCLTRARGRSTYKRLLGQTVYLDCPTAEQAELAIEAILSFAQSLDGKWLAPAEPAQAVEPQAQAQSAGDLQAIGTASAPSEPEPTAAASSESVQDDEAQGFSGS
jgi:hypothetical protein